MCTEYTAWTQLKSRHGCFANVSQLPFSTWNKKNYVELYIFWRKCEWYLSFGYLWVSVGFIVNNVRREQWNVEKTISWQFITYMLWRFAGYLKNIYNLISTILYNLKKTVHFHTIQIIRIQAKLLIKSLRFLVRSDCKEYRVSRCIF